MAAAISPPFLLQIYHNILEERSQWKICWEYVYVVFFNTGGSMVLFFLTRVFGGGWEGGFAYVGN